MTNAERIEQIRKRTEASAKECTPKWGCYERQFDKISDVTFVTFTSPMIGIEKNKLLMTDYDMWFLNHCLEDMQFLLDRVQKLEGWVMSFPDIPDDCGEHTHKGFILDHKDCDAIRNAKKEAGL